MAFCVCSASAQGLRQPNGSLAASVPVSAAHADAPLFNASDRRSAQPHSTAPDYDPAEGDGQFDVAKQPSPLAADAERLAPDNHWVDPDHVPAPVWQPGESCGFLKRELHDLFFSPPLDGRHRGRGHPLERESWLTHPYHLDFIVGGLFQDDPREGQIEGGSGFVGGARLGWDWHHFWGLESRLLRSSVGLEHANQTTSLGNMRVYAWDLDLLYYPFGDARWRPYLTMGLGLYDANFVDVDNERIHETLFGLPWGFGVKYRLDSRIAFRLDAVDNVAFGEGNRLDTMHNWSFTGGMEFRFGGRRRSYFPWNPSRNWW